MNRNELAARLKTGEAALHSGGVVYRLRTSLPEIADHLLRFYPPERFQPADFADYHLYVRPIRRWRRSVVVGMEGGFEYAPVPVAQAPAYLEWSLNRCHYGWPNPRLLIHSASLVQNGRGVILAGGSGSGKSTLCAALALSDWKLCSDEMAIVDPQTLHLQGLERPVILKNESRDVIERFDASCRFGPGISGTLKGVISHLQIDSHHTHDDLPAAPSWIVFVKYNAEATLSLERLEPGIALLRLARNSFNRNLLGEAGFELLATIAETCPAFKLTYSDLHQAVDLIQPDSLDERAGATNAPMIEQEQTS